MGGFKTGQTLTALVSAFNVSLAALTQALRRERARFIVCRYCSCMKQKMRPVEAFAFRLRETVLTLIETYQINSQVSHNFSFVVFR